MEDDYSSRMRKRQAKKEEQGRNISYELMKAEMRKPPTVPNVIISKETADKYKLDDIDFGYKKKKKIQGKRKR